MQEGNNQTIEGPSFAIIHNIQGWKSLTTGIGFTEETSTPPGNQVYYLEKFSRLVITATETITLQVSVISNSLLDNIFDNDKNFIIKIGNLSQEFIKLEQNNFIASSIHRFILNSSISGAYYMDSQDQIQQYIPNTPVKTYLFAAPPGGEYFLSQPFINRLTYIAELDVKADKTKVITKDYTPENTGSVQMNCIMDLIIQPYNYSVFQISGSMPIAIYCMDSKFTVNGHCNTLIVTTNPVMSFKIPYVSHQINLCAYNDRNLEFSTYLVAISGKKSTVFEPRLTSGKARLAVWYIALKEQNISISEKPINVFSSSSYIADIGKIPNIFSILYIVDASKEVKISCDSADSPFCSSIEYFNIVFFSSNGTDKLTKNYGIIGSGIFTLQPNTANLFGFDSLIGFGYFIDKNFNDTYIQGVVEYKDIIFRINCFDQIVINVQKEMRMVVMHNCIDTDTNIFFFGGTTSQYISRVGNRTGSIPAPKGTNTFWFISPDSEVFANIRGSPETVYWLDDNILKECNDTPRYEQYQLAQFFMPVDATYLNVFQVSKDPTIDQTIWSAKIVIKDQVKLTPIKTRFLHQVGSSIINYTIPANGSLLFYFEEKPSASVILAEMPYKFSLWKDGKHYIGGTKHRLITKGAGGGYYIEIRGVYHATQLVVVSTLIYDILSKKNSYGIISASLTKKITRTEKDTDMKMVWWAVAYPFGIRVSMENAKMPPILRRIDTFARGEEHPKKRRIVTFVLDGEGNVKEAGDHYEWVKPYQSLHERPFRGWDHRPPLPFPPAPPPKPGNRDWPENDGPDMFVVTRGVDTFEFHGNFETEKYYAQALAWNHNTSFVVELLVDEPNNSIDAPITVTKLRYCSSICIGNEDVATAMTRDINLSEIAIVAIIISFTLFIMIVLLIVWRSRRKLKNF